MEELKSKKAGDQFIDYGVAISTAEGERQSGDEYVVHPFADGALVALVDGLGHGYEASQAARTAVETLKTYAGESVIALVRRCHGALRNTRGAAMSLAFFNAVDSTITWMGIGNVSGVLIRPDSADLRRREILLIRSGVVGAALPLLRASVVAVCQADKLIFATDGVEAGFYDGININDSPQEIADSVLNTHNKGTDDAMVLVTQFLEKTT